MLAENGHTVRTFALENRRITSANTWAAGLSATWNQRSYAAVRSQIREFRPDLVQIHNFFPLLSPSVFYAAKAEGVPVVQTLHNYRLMCPRADLWREGKACEDCMGKLIPWAGIRRACYRQSRLATTAVGAMAAIHKTFGTWNHTVSKYIVTTEFARQKFEAWGLPKDRLVVKPNFLGADPGPGDGDGGFVLYAGRLSPEKGIAPLLAAYTTTPSPPLPLKIAGCGPLEGDVSAAVQATRTVEWLGWQPLERVLALMKQAALVVVPSTCYEGFPMTIVEAFACGSPVLASRIGGLPGIVEHGRTGLLAEPGDVADLREKIAWAAAHPFELRRMRAEARAEFLAKYTAERNYHALMEIYEGVLHPRPAAAEPRAAAAHAAGNAG